MEAWGWISYYDSWKNYQLSCCKLLINSKYNFDVDWLSIEANTKNELDIFEKIQVLAYHINFDLNILHFQLPYLAWLPWYHATYPIPSPWSSCVASLPACSFQLRLAPSTSTPWSCPPLLTGARYWDGVVWSVNVVPHWAHNRACSLTGIG